MRNKILSASEQAKLDKERINNKSSSEDHFSYESKGFIESNDPNECGLRNTCTFGRHNPNF